MSAKTIIGKNKGMRGSEKKVKRKKKLPSYGADRTRGLNLKFSNTVRKQNKQGMNEAKDIIKKSKVYKRYRRCRFKYFTKQKKTSY